MDGSYSFCFLFPQKFLLLFFSGIHELLVSFAVGAPPPPLLRASLLYCTVAGFPTVALLVASILLLASLLFAGISASPFKSLNP
jgi:hypothetical protein